jgi:hypothetical protein
MALVEDHHRLLVGRVVGRPLLLVRAKGRLDLGWQLGSQPLHLGHPGGHARRRALSDQRDESVRPPARVLHPEHPAPRMAEDVDALEAEGVADRIDLVDEQLWRPDRRVVLRVDRRVAGPELVVEHDLPLVGQGLVRLHVQPVRAGPAVQAEERDRIAAVGADRPVPRLVAAERDPPFGHRHRAFVQARS